MTIDVVLITPENIDLLRRHYPALVEGAPTAATKCSASANDSAVPDLRYLEKCVDDPRGLKPSNEVAIALDGNELAGLIVTAIGEDSRIHKSIKWECINWNYSGAPMHAVVRALLSGRARATAHRGASSKTRTSRARCRRSRASTSATLPRG
jgi:hypothetical protein